MTERKNSPRRARRKRKNKIDPRLRGDDRGEPGLKVRMDPGNYSPGGYLISSGLGVVTQIRW